MTKKRVAYMDIARGLAVIAVIVGHSGTPLRNFLYLFHVPLFFFISGYFYKESYTDHPLQFIKKRFKTLYLPFVLWELAFLSLHDVFYNLHIYNEQFGSRTQLYTMQDYIFRLQKILTFTSTEDLAAIFWFLTVLFELSVIFVFISYILRKVFQKQSEIYRFVVICGMFLLGCFFSLNTIKLQNKLDIVCTVSIFYYLGFIYKKFEHSIPYRGLYFMLGNVLLLATSLFAYIELVQNIFPNVLLLLLTSLIGIYCTLYLAQSMEHRPRIDRVLSFIGRHSIPILALHLLAFKAIHLIQIAIFHHPPESLAAFPVINGGYGWWILYSLAGTLLPIIAILALTKFKRAFGYLGH